MRRSVRVLMYMPTNPDTDPSIHYSFFNWNYLMPQGLLAPKSVNRQASPAQRRGVGARRAFAGVWVDTEIHPIFRVALDPYLRKLPLTREIPQTSVREAIDDYTAHASKVGHVASRHGWLAKVAQLAAVRRSSSDVLPVWADECHELYVTGDDVPPRSLALAMCYCTAASCSPEWRSFFQCCLQSKWDISKTFPTRLWSELFRCAGKLEDEEGVMALLDEAVDLRVDFDVLNDRCLVQALNAVRSPEAYGRVKKFLFMLSEEKVNQLFRAYFSRRNAAERNEEIAETFKDNDNMFYHVHWHKSIRNPLSFLPRRLYFNYKPTSFVQDEAKFIKKTADQILEERLAKWKEQGLVPEDYVDQQKIVDTTERFKFWQRQETWKRKPKINPKTPGYVPPDAQVK